MSTTPEELTIEQKYRNKTYQNDLDNYLINNISLSAFLFIAAININSFNKSARSISNDIILVGLLTLSVGFAIIALIYFTTEIFNELSPKQRHREQFNYAVAIIYTVFVSALIIIEIMFAKEFIYKL